MSVAQPFLLALSVQDGLGMQVWSHESMGDFSHLRIVPAPHTLVACSRKGRVPFCILGVPNNSDTRDGLWVWAPRNSHQKLEFGPRGIPGLQCGILVVQ